MPEEEAQSMQAALRQVKLQEKARQAASQTERLNRAMPNLSRRLGLDELGKTLNVPEKNRDLSPEDKQKRNEMLAGQGRTHAFVKSASVGKGNAVMTGARLGFQVRHAVASGQFSGELFWTALFIALLKDFTDLASLGMFGSFVNVAAVIAFFLMFFGSGTFVKRWVVRRAFLMFIEFIPLINTVPTYTIGVLVLKMAADKHARQIANANEELGRELKYAEQEA